MHSLWHDAFFVPHNTFLRKVIPSSSSQLSTHEKKGPSMLGGYTDMPLFDACLTTQASMLGVGLALQEVDHNGRHNSLLSMLWYAILVKICISLSYGRKFKV